MTPATPRIGCIGTGVLGAAIVHRLIERGLEPLAWNRDRTKLDPLVAAGGRAAASPDELTRACAFVITCVSDGDALEQVMFGEHGVARAGNADKVLIDMSTCAIEHTREMAKRLNDACGMAWLDAPISGGPPAALQGRMAIMVGGDPDVFERARPIWDALARRATLMGPQGAGQATKMINQVLVATGIAALAEACAFAERMGIDATRIPAALAGGRADSTQLQELFPKMAASEFSVGARMALLLKDLELVRELAANVGASLPLTNSATASFRTMVNAGNGNCDNTELVRLYRGP